MRVVKRSEAIARGVRRYFTGRPCVHGHIAERITSDRHCVVCKAITIAKWYAKNKKHALRYRLARHQANRDKALAAFADYYQHNKVRLNRKHAEWRRKNPERQRMMRQGTDQRRAARKRNAGGTFTIRDIEKLISKQRGRCAACKRRVVLTIDHKTPLARGGSNGRANIQLLCKPCNQSKGARTMKAWRAAMQQRGPK